MAEGPNTHVARLDGIRLTYDEGATWALDGVNLTLERGEWLCVLGANGSGKSTLASLVAGLLAPDQGTVELMGRTVFDGQTADGEGYRAARRAVGYVFQNPEDQIVTTCVADDVAFGPENLGVESSQIQRRVDESLHHVAMGSFAQADPTKLSGGQQQRVAIAGALAMEPQVLVLDEPGALLDVRGREGIMHVAHRMRDAGTTILHVTHFMEEALEADRVVVLDAGHVVLEGTPSEVFAHEDLIVSLGLELPFSLQLERRLAGHANETDDGGRQVASTPAHTDAAVTISNLSYGYGSAPALDGVSFGVSAGELLCVVGQTGSGKSTLMRAIAALAMPDAGTVDVMGIDTTDRTRRRELRRHLGYVMQRPERQLFAETVGADVAFGPNNLGLDDVDGRVERALDFLGISHLRDRSPFDLSGGQQRMAALAGILAMEPQVLLMDEPTAGLDPRGRARLKDLIAQLRQRGITIVMVTHSMDDVAQLASRAVVLDGGRVLTSGTSSEVFSHEKLLREHGLGIPRALAYAHRLERAGHAPLGDPLTLDALAAALGGER